MKPGGSARRLHSGRFAGAIRDLDRNVTAAIRKAPLIHQSRQLLIDVCKVDFYDFSGHYVPSQRSIGGQNNEQDEACNQACDVR
jgi:hypothetical protein